MTIARPAADPPAHAGKAAARRAGIASGNRTRIGHEGKDGRPASLLAVTVVDGRIVEIDVLADPERLARLVD